MQTKSEGRICVFCECLAIHDIKENVGVEERSCRHCGHVSFQPIAVVRKAA